MDLVDSFVPSFKRKAPEAQSYVELRKLEEPSNIQFVDIPLNADILNRVEASPDENYCFSLII